MPVIVHDASLKKPTYVIQREAVFGGATRKHGSLIKDQCLRDLGNCKCGVCCKSNLLKFLISDVYNDLHKLHRNWFNALHKVDCYSTYLSNVTYVLCDLGITPSLTTYLDAGGGKVATREAMSTGRGKLPVNLYQAACIVKCPWAQNRPWRQVHNETILVVWWEHTNCALRAGTHQSGHWNVYV